MYRAIYCFWLAQLISVIPFSAVGGHAVAHGLRKARQQLAARLSHFTQDRAPPLGYPRQIAIDVSGIAVHNRMLRPFADAGPPATDQGVPAFPLPARLCSRGRSVRLR